jgi:dihydrofolate reductase
MTITLIAAVAKNNVIGSKNDLPWYLPEDLKRFKQITLGHTVLMGRKTYDSIIARLGKPLPERKSVVITRNKDFAAPEGVQVFNSLDEALTKLQNQDIYVIGGAQIFQQIMPKADKMFLTLVDKEYPGDTFFPKIDPDIWEQTKKEVHEGFSFAEYERGNR